MFLDHGRIVSDVFFAFRLTEGFGPHTKHVIFVFAMRRLGASSGVRLRAAFWWLRAAFFGGFAPLSGHSSHISALIVFLGRFIRQTAVLKINM